MTSSRGLREKLCLYFLYIILAGPFASNDRMYSNTLYLNISEYLSSFFYFLHRSIFYFLNNFYINLKWSVLLVLVMSLLECTQYFGAFLVIIYMSCYSI